MRFKKYWTPRYVFDKIRYLLFLKRHPDLPWITPRAIKVLEQYLSKDQTALEVGSGKGTGWIATRVKQLTSLEHDEHYFVIVKEQLSKNNINNVTLVLKSRNDDSPEHSAYINYLKEIPGKFDFIFIDGIYREHCTEILIEKLNSQGILMLDDCQRFIPGRSRAPYALKADMKPLTKTWANFIERTKSWKKIRTTDGMRDNCIYFKP